LFVPTPLLPESGTTFIEHAQSKYWPFRNTFSAASVAGPEPLADSAMLVVSGGQAVERNAAMRDRP
jgi:hypothetical protein